MRNRLLRNAKNKISHNQKTNNEQSPTPESKDTMLKSANKSDLNIDESIRIRDTPEDFQELVKNSRRIGFMEITDNNMNTIKEVNENEDTIKSPIRKSSRKQVETEQLRSTEHKGSITKSTKVHTNSLNKEITEFKLTSSKNLTGQVFGKGKKSNKEILVKKQTLKYNSPELDLAHHINQLRFLAESNKMNSKENNIIVNPDEKKPDNLDNNKNQETEENETINLNKKMKIYSKYSDLVIGDRMSDERKAELGIIPMKRNPNFNKKKNDLPIFNIINLEKKDKNTKNQTTKNTSLIKFIPKSFKLDPSDEYYMFEEKRKKDAQIRKDYLHPQTATHMGSKANKSLKQMMDLNIPSNESNENLTIPGTNIKGVHLNKNSLAYMVKVQFNKIKIQNLVEPEKIMECTQDKFVRNKTEYVLEFQELNREIGK